MSFRTARRNVAEDRIEYRYVTRSVNDRTYPGDWGTSIKFCEKMLVALRSFDIFAEAWVEQRANGEVRRLAGWSREST